MSSTQVYASLRCRSDAINKRRAATQAAMPKHKQGRKTSARKHTGRDFGLYLSEAAQEALLVLTKHYGITPNKAINNAIVALALRVAMDNPGVYAPLD